MGLSQAIGFAKQSRGDIRVTSTVGEGTAFTLYVPRVLPEQSISPEAREASPPLNGDGRCVLVVEDNQEVGAFATQALRELGFETELAQDAAQALSKLEEGKDRIHISSPMSSCRG